MDRGPEASRAAKAPTSPEGIPVLPGYEIVGELGTGAMGSVYKARQITLDRIVALKLLPSSFAADSSYVARFKQECRAAARLKHSGIVQVYEAGEVDGTYYFAMEFIAGYSVGHWVKTRKHMEEEDGLTVALGVADALKYAWAEAGIIHRDVKPDNILIDRDGTVKVADLGLAKSLSSGDGTVTMAGVTMGTPYYCSPEQINAADTVDFRTDIYALGSTLYHMVTGVMPFQGETGMKAMICQVTEQIDDPIEVMPSLSPGICALIELMLVKDPAKRYPDWQSLVDDMDLVAHGEMPTRPLPKEGESTIRRSPQRAGAAVKKRRRPAAGKASAAGRSADPVADTVVVSYRRPFFQMLVVLVLLLCNLIVWARHLYDVDLIDWSELLAPPLTPRHVRSPALVDAPVAAPTPPVPAPPTPLPSPPPVVDHREISLLGRIQYALGETLDLSVNYYHNDDESDVGSDPSTSWFITYQNQDERLIPDVKTYKLSREGACRIRVVYAPDGAVALEEVMTVTIHPLARPRPDAKMAELLSRLKSERLRSIAATGRDYRVRVREKVNTLRKILAEVPKHESLSQPEIREELVLMWLETLRDALARDDYAVARSAVISALPLYGGQWSALVADWAEKGFEVGMGDLLPRVGAGRSLTVAAAAEAGARNAYLDMVLARQEASPARILPHRMTVQTFADDPTGRVKREATIRLVLVPEGRLPTRGGEPRPIRSPLYMAEIETTIGAVRCYRDGARVDLDNRPELSAYFSGQLPSNPVRDDDFPFAGATPDVAIEFCNWLSLRHGLEPVYARGSDGAWTADVAIEGYRLPTTEEWEYVARYGFDWLPAEGHESWERMERALLASADGAEQERVWFSYKASARRTPFTPGSRYPLGVYDMCGNVAELCTVAARRTDERAVVALRSAGGNYKSRSARMVVPGAFEDVDPAAAGTGFRIVLQVPFADLSEF